MEEPAPPTSAIELLFTEDVAEGSVTVGEGGSIQISYTDLFGIDRFLTGIPARFDSGTEDVRFSGVVISIDGRSHKAKTIKRIHCPLDPEDE